MELIERMLGIHLISIYYESKKLVELKLLAMMLEGVRFFRPIIFNFMLCTFAFVILTIGIIVIIIQSLNLYHLHGLTFYDPMIQVGLLMVLIGGPMTFIFMSEKTWLRVFHLEKHLHHAVEVTKSHSLPPTPPEQGLDMQMLASIVNSIVEQKLKERQEQENSKTNL